MQPSNHLPAQFFVTERLTFRPFHPDDRDSLVHVQSDPLLCQYVGDGSLLSPEIADLWIKTSRENVRRFGYGTGAVTLNQTGELIGWAGFSRPEGQAEEIIYGFARKYWRQGFGSEILAALISYAKEQTELTVLNASVDSQNAASRALLTKHRFKLTHRDYLGDVGCDLYQLALSDSTSSSNS